MNIPVEQTNMIKQQLRTGDVLSPRILELYDEIPRHQFVPAAYQHFAYSDLQIPLAQGQRMMTPLEEAKLLQALQLTGQETVLEIGTGTGFLTALLSRLSKRVTTVDYFAEFTQDAKKLLAEHNCTNVTLHTGDASRGWIKEAPFDVVVFTGAVEKLVKTQMLQVMPGGKLFIIVGEAPVMQAQMHTVDHDNRWTMEILYETCLPALIDPLKKPDFEF